MTAPAFAIGCAVFTLLVAAFASWGGWRFAEPVSRAHGVITAILFGAFTAMWLTLMSAVAITVLFGQH